MHGATKAFIEDWLAVLLWEFWLNNFILFLKIVIAKALEYCTYKVGLKLKFKRVASYVLSNFAVV